MNKAAMNIVQVFCEHIFKKFFFLDKHLGVELLDHRVDTYLTL